MVVLLLLVVVLPVSIISPISRFSSLLQWIFTLDPSLSMIEFVFSLLVGSGQINVIHLPVVHIVNIS